MTDKIEEWRDISGYEGFYQVSNTGKVRSLPRTITVNSITQGLVRKNLSGKQLKLHQDKNGYLYVWLWKNGKKFSRVHKLVADAFVTGNGEYVLHKDGNNQNNSSENLYRGSQLENIADAIRHGTIKRKLTEQQVIRIREMHKGKSVAEISKNTGILYGTVDAVIKRRSWKHVQ